MMLQEVDGPHTLQGLASDMHMPGSEVYSVFRRRRRNKYFPGPVLLPAACLNLPSFTHS